MTRLSVNINKVALLRNARGGNLPDLLRVARDCEAFGADGITVHPRPDERHIRYQDVRDLKSVVQTEFNVEGYPNDRFMELVLEVKPHQCTLVPDAPDQLTSDHGWDTIGQKYLLSDVVATLKAAGIRVSLFADPAIKIIEGAAEVGADRVELYTGVYAKRYAKRHIPELEAHIEAARRAADLGLGVNAGHDLNLMNLKVYREAIPTLDEVSIGQALISDSLYYGLHNTIQMYKRCLQL